MILCLVLATNMTIHYEDHHLIFINQPLRFRFIAGLGFYGLNFNVGNLTGSIYVNNVVSGCAEIPQFLVILFSTRMGRKVLTIIALFLGAVSLISAAFMSAYLDDSKYRSLLYLTGRNLH